MSGGHSAPYYLLSAEARFSAAHTLPGVEMCDRVHGHNWRVRLTVRVPEKGLDESGMGIDFRAIQEIANETVADFEHRYLNDLDEFREQPPTAERIARLVCDRAALRLGAISRAGRMEQVELWEMPEYRVVYRPA